MGISVEPLDLAEIRRDQRRIKGLLGRNDVIIQQFPIRRKPLPAGYCYVCSRIDPEGKFKHPHGYLFSKGFFSQCEHMPKTPFPTVIIDNRVPSPVNSEPSPSVSRLRVKITRRSKSPPSKYGRKYFDKRALNGVRYRNDEFYESTRYTVPPMFDHASMEDGDGKTVPEVGQNTFVGLGRDSDDEDIIVNYIENSDDDEAGILDYQSEEGNLRISPSERGSFLPPIPGAKSKSYNNKSMELLQPTLSEKLPSIHGSVERINASRERLENKVSRKRPTGSRGRKTEKEGNDILGNNDDDYGHIKYHHRGMYDSVPSGGFQMPSSRPETQDQNNVERSALEKENDKKSVSRLSSDDVSLGIPETPSMIIARINNSDHWCQCKHVDMSKLKCPECHIIGGHEKWCVHFGSVTFQGICPECSKPIKRNNRGSNNKQKSRRGSKNTYKSDDTLPRLQDDIDSKRVRFEDEDFLSEYDKRFEETRNNNDDKRIDRMLSEDEDYMTGVDDILYDKEHFGRLWTPSSDVDEGEKKRIDPNIHRDAYLRALLEVKNNQLKKIKEIDEKYYASRLCRPHVFSYFRLRPRQAEHNALSAPCNIGLTPDDTKGSPPRKGMKHIFGKVKVDDFYPGGKRNHSLAITMKREDKKQTMPIHSISYGKE